MPYILGEVGEREWAQEGGRVDGSGWPPAQVCPGPSAPTCQTVLCQTVSTHLSDRLCPRASEEPILRTQGTQSLAPRAEREGVSTVSAAQCAVILAAMEL